MCQNERKKAMPDETGTAMINILKMTYFVMPT